MSLGRNISSVFHNILSLTACWTDNTLAGQGPDQASFLSALRQMKTIWDSAIPVVDSPPVTPAASVPPIGVPNLSNIATQYS